MMRFVGALLFTFFLSRALQYVGLRNPPVWKLVASHILSFGILTLLVIALRQPLDIYQSSQLYVYGIGQLLWLLLDFYRAQVAFWKPPVTPTESSPTPREGSTP